MDQMKLLAELLQRPANAITLDTALADIEGWDSLTMVRLMMRLEQYIGRQLTEDEMAELVSVRDVHLIVTGNK